MNSQILVCRNLLMAVLGWGIFRECMMKYEAPQLIEIELEETAGDPTIGDDGLGDGLFS